MNYVESLDVLGIELKQIPCIKGEGTPTTKTEGAVGCFYMNTLTGVLYKCIAIDNGAYTWTTFEGEKGDAGKDGVTFTPIVSADGTLSWTNNGGLTNPEPVNIVGNVESIGEIVQTIGNSTTAVMSQKAVTDTINGLKKSYTPKIVIGTFTNGALSTSGNHTRARFDSNIAICATEIVISASTTYKVGFMCYDNNGTYDGVDHGWNNISNGKRFIPTGAYFNMHFARIDGVAMTDTDLETLSTLVTVYDASYNTDIENLTIRVNKMSDNNLISVPFSIEHGTFSSEGVLEDVDWRMRFTESVNLTNRTKITILANSNYMFGYAHYDKNGVYDGINHGWNSMASDTELVFTDGGYVRFNFRTAANGTCTDEDIATVTDLISIYTEGSLAYLDEKYKEFVALCNQDVVESINVEYGRCDGATYNFVRIPKTSNNGNTIKPVIALTSSDGSLNGTKCSALTFSKNNNLQFTINAGLFDTSAMIPVGQTIIDGVSITNTPMADDNGTPISATECYPLCIDANGNLSAPYTRSVDTATMIADGVKYAITGWGKLVDNFEITQSEIDAEIVHKSKNYSRQCIGQFENGDYCVLTAWVGGYNTNYQNEAGLTYEECAQILVDHGVKFAYSLDGGGSAETVIKRRQINPIYEGKNGRSVPSVIYFTTE